MAVLQNIKVEADTLKVRCLNEIEKEEAKAAAAKAPVQGEENTECEDNTAPVPRMKKKKL